MSSDVQRYFDDHAEQYMQKGKLIPQFILRQLDDQNPDRIVDIGCGSGDFLAAAADITSADVVGTEIAKNILPDDSPATFLLGAAPNLPFDDDTFDLTRIDTVIHHIVGDSRATSKELAVESLEELFRITAPDGRIIITERHQEARAIPDKVLSQAIFSGLKYGSGVLEKIDPRVHNSQPPIAFYTEQEFKDIIYQAGGEVQATYDNRYSGHHWLQKLIQKSSLRKTWVITPKPPQSQ